MGAREEFPLPDGTGWAVVLVWAEMCDTIDVLRATVRRFDEMTDGALVAAMHDAGILSDAGTDRLIDDVRDPFCRGEGSCTTPGHVHTDGTRGNPPRKEWPEP